MRKMFRTTLSMLLAVLMTFCTLPFEVFAADTNGTCGSGVFWEYSNGTLSITSSNNSSMENYSASSDPGWVTEGWSDSITKVTVTGVKKIGNYAFYGLNNVTSVTLDAYLESIGTYAFSFCSSLTELVLPANLDSIGQHAFKDSGIKKITFTRNSLTSAGSGTRQAFRSLSGAEIYVPEGFKLANKTAEPSKYGSEPFYKNYVGYTNSSKASVYWKDDDGSVLSGETFDAGTTPSYTDEFEEKDDGTVFDKWEPVPSAVEANKIYYYTATYSIPNYTITWANWDGTVLETDVVEKGTTPSYDGETPERHNDNPEKYYAFSGWNPTVTAANEDITYTAQFEQCDKDPVSYVNAKGEAQPQITSYEKLTAGLPSYTLDATVTDWWIVEGEVTINERIIISGDINLLLCDGGELTATKGITVAGDNQLTIWQQAGGNGELVINGNSVAVENAAIGGSDGNSGLIIINGGDINVKGGYEGAGIGGGRNGEGTVTVNGGNVIAKSGEGPRGYGKGAAGIGGGYNGKGTVTVNGGTVNATGNYGAGIGGGFKGVSDVTVNGGMITAKGLNGGAGVGCGSNNDVVNPSGTIIGAVTIHGGTVTASSEAGGAGIGGGRQGTAVITITDGNVTANGGALASGSPYGGAGIGCGYYCESEEGSVTISGGIVNASRGGSAAGGIGVDSYSSSVRCPVTLTWTVESKDSMSVTSDSYRGTVTLEKKFKAMDGDNPLIFEAGTLDDISTIAGLTLTPAGSSAWQVLQYLLANSENGSTITLAQDYIADAEDTYLSIPSGKEITLDLNGYTIDRNLSASADDGSVIVNNGTLTINDSSANQSGVIKGGYNNLEGGGAIYNSGILTINAGTFRENKSSLGGAIYNEGVLNLNGGTISDNSCSATNGGGIYTNSQGSLNISGNPIVKDNTAKGEANDIYLMTNQTLNITDTLGSDAKIGVYEQSAGTGTAFTQGLNENGDDSNFFSNNASYKVVLNNDGEAYTVEDRYVITIEEPKYGTVTADKETALAGETVTLTVAPEEGGSVKSVRVNDEEITAVNGVYSFTMPADDVTVTAEFNRLPIPYVDANGAAQEPLTDYDIVTDATDTMAAGWYVVKDTINNDNRIVVSGNVDLLLCDGAELNAAKGIQVQWKNPAATLTIWQQERGTGELNATATDSGYAGIGGNSSRTSGDITISGGIINAQGATNGAGIGSGYYQPTRPITINAGCVTAVGGSGGAGIGGGSKGLATIVINGGTVNATGGARGAGIGSGRDSSYVANRTLSVTINGGTITANGGSNASAIGGGDQSTGAGCNININGGQITANGGSNGGYGINSAIHSNNAIKLNWAEAVRETMTVYSSSYNGKVTLLNTFRDDSHSAYAIGTIDDLTVLADKTLTPSTAQDKYNLTLKENIDVNILIDVAGHLTDGEEIEKVVLTYPDVTTQSGETKTETATEVTADASGYFAKSFTMAVAQAAEPITAMVYFTDGKTKNITVSVASYCKYIIDNATENNYPDSLVDLCYTALEYGYTAADYFNYSAEYPEYTLPEKFNAEPSITSQAGISYGSVVTGIQSTQMYILSKATMRLTFKDDISALTVTSVKVGGEASDHIAAEIVQAPGGKWAVDISGIYATELNKPILIELSDGTKVQYAATDWAKSILAYSTNTKSKALAKALYYYSETANAYFGG